MVHRKKKEAWDGFLGKFDEAYRGNHKMMWNLVKRLVPGANKASLQPIKDSDGVLATSEEEIREAWAQHQAKLGTPTRDAFQDDVFTSAVEREVVELVNKAERQVHQALDEEFSIEEVEEATESLNYYKAGAADGTKNPMFKCGGHTMNAKLHILFNHLRKEEVLPVGWGSSEVVNLYKEGDKTDPGNYRGIALISCLGKIYLSLWARRLATSLEPELSEEQGGFRRWRSTIDQALTLKEILFQRKASGNSTYVCFVDFRKAFDTVWHDGLWKRLWDSKVQGKPWRILRKLYSTIRSSVRVGNGASRSVRMMQGVRQGCPLSPVLFNCFIDELAMKLKEADCGLYIDGRQVESLLYADDVVLMTYSAEKLQSLINVVDTFCRQWHMDINVGKSKVMIVNPLKQDTEVQHTFTCRESELKQVKEYKYLGIYFTHNLSWGRHIEEAIAKATKRTDMMRGLLCNSRVSTNAKFLVWKAYVRPLLDYGGEVWEPTQDQARKLEAVQTRAGVLGLKLNEHTNAHAVRLLMRCPSLENRRKRARFNHWYKLMAMDKPRLARFVQEIKIVNDKKPVWLKRVEEEIKGDELLLKGWESVMEAQRRNGGSVPRVEGTGEDAVHHLKHWKQLTKEWVARVELQTVRGEANHDRSTLKLIVRSLAGLKDTLPKFPITRGALKGPHQVRIRLLSGTSALNDTLSKFRPRSEHCPWNCAAAEDAEHFYMQCAGFQAARAPAFAKFSTSCCCKDEDEEKRCWAHYSKLDDSGKLCMLLGAEVEGKSFDNKIGKAVDALTAQAWDIRSKKLERKYKLHDKVAVAPAGRIERFFISVSSPLSPPNPLPPTHPERRRSQKTQHKKNAQPPAGAGSNGLIATERK